MASASVEDRTPTRLHPLCTGRQLPLVDRVEVFIIDEQQPRWLAFLNGEHDLLDRLPATFVNIAVPADSWHRIQTTRHHDVASAWSDVTYTVFNMKDPVIGGYTPDKRGAAARNFIGLERARRRYEFHVAVRLSSPITVESAYVRIRPEL